MAGQGRHAGLRRDRHGDRDAGRFADDVDRPRRGRGAEDAERIVEADGRIAGVDEPARDVAEPVEAAARDLVVDDDALRLLTGARRPRSRSARGCARR